MGTVESESNEMLKIPTFEVFATMIKLPCLKLALLYYTKVALVLNQVDTLNSSSLSKSNGVSAVEI